MYYNPSFSRNLYGSLMLDINSSLLQVEVKNILAANLQFKTFTIQIRPSLCSSTFSFLVPTDHHVGHNACRRHKLRFKRNENICGNLRLQQLLFSCQKSNLKTFLNSDVLNKPNTFNLWLQTTQLKIIQSNILSQNCLICRLLVL